MSKGKFLAAFMDRYPRLSWWTMAALYAVQVPILWVLIPKLYSAYGSSYFFGLLVLVASVSAMLFVIERVRRVLYGADYYERDFE